MKGSVIRSINNTYIAEGEDGGKYSLRIKGKVLEVPKWEHNPIAVGDCVIFTPYSKSEGLITERLERKSEFTRFLNKVSLNQTVAANMDQAVVITAVKSPEFHPHFIDRAISAIKGCPVIIVVNKTDLGLGAEEKSLKLYESLGYVTVRISVRNNDIFPLLPLLENKLTLFLGQSGVGKSSLVNLITGSEQKTADISAKYNTGRHTTTHALSLKKGNIEIIDTPGIREILPPFEDLRHLKASFPELSGLKCKYSDCLHDGEEGCALPSLLHQGLIDESRYSGYISLLNDLREVQERMVRKKWQ